MIEKYLNQRNINYIYASGNNEIRINCVCCIDDKYHLYINIKDNLGNCKKCNYSPNFIKLVSDIEGIAYHEAKEFITNKFDDRKADSSQDLIERIKRSFEVEEEMEKPVEYVKTKLPVGCNKLTKHKNSVMAKLHRNYVLNRGLTQKVIDEYDIGYVIDANKKYNNRIIIPCRIDNKLTFFSGRTIENKKPKTVFPDLLEAPTGKANVINNYDKIKNNNKNYVVIVEGEFDMLNINEIAINLYGRFMSENQFKLIRSLNKEIVLMLDADAKKQQISIYRKLYGRVNVSAVFLDKGDPGDHYYTELFNLIEKRKSYSPVELISYIL